MSKGLVETWVDKKLETLEEELEEAEEDLQKSEYFKIRSEIESQREELYNEYGHGGELMAELSQVTEEINELMPGETAEPVETEETTETEETEDASDPEPVQNNEDSGHKYSTGGSIEAISPDELYLAVKTDILQWDLDEVFYNNSKDMINAQNQLKQEGLIDSSNNLRKSKITEDQMKKIEAIAENHDQSVFKGLVAKYGRQDDPLMYTDNKRQDIIVSKQPEETTEPGDRIYVQQTGESGKIGFGELLEIYDPVEDIKDELMFEEHRVERLEIQDDKHIKAYKQDTDDEVHPEALYIASHIGATDHTLEELFYDSEDGEISSSLNRVKRDLADRDIIYEEGEQKPKMFIGEEPKRALMTITSGYELDALHAEVEETDGESMQVFVPSVYQEFRIDANGMELGEGDEVLVENYDLSERTGEAAEML